MRIAMFSLIYKKVIVSFTLKAKHLTVAYVTFRPVCWKIDGFVSQGTQSTQKNNVANSSFWQLSIS